MDAMDAMDATDAPNKSAYFGNSRLSYGYCLKAFGARQSKVTEQQGLSKVAFLRIEEAMSP
jgi:hypothetical protein